MALSGNQVKTNAITLQRFWNKRNVKFREWYEQIRMVDTLAQTNMESFVGNDPRASFNLVSSILNQKIPHRLPPDYITQEQLGSAAELSRMFEVIWERVYDNYRLRGRDFFEDLIGFLLVTGWYSVFASMTLDGGACIAEVWNPTTVYPAWDDRLVECAHIFTPGATAIAGMARRNGWTLSFIPSANSTVYDYWWLEWEFMRPVVHNSVVIDSDCVKPDTVETRFKRIPIFTAPVGGLPDTGPLATRATTDWWKQEIGQSFLATNENVFRTTNKWWTFVLQLLRDTAQARTFERTTNPQQIVKPETWYRRGAHYKLGPNDEVGFISPPPIPVELRGTQLDLEAMAQRGGPNWAMYGTLPQRMTAYAMSQIAASTHQVSRSYHKGIINCISDIDNFWYETISDKGYKPYGIGLPPNLPAGVKVTAEYELKVPGDLVQRATTSRMLNPDFELSDEYIIEHNFPEIKNPAEELARVRASKARKNPIYAQITLIEALREDAEILRRAKDLDGATLLEKAADRLEQQIIAEPQEPEGETPGLKVRPEVTPPGTSPRNLEGRVT